MTPLAEFAEVLSLAIPKLLELFAHGGRDAILVALDDALAEARLLVDAELAAKHRPPGTP